jgi:hypothetical protein
MSDVDRPPHLNRRAPFWMFDWVDVNLVSRSPVTVILPYY